MGKPNPYPSLTFNPPLASTVSIADPSTIIPEPRLRWQATVGLEDYERLCSTKGEVQVWSNCAGEEWSATPFRATIYASDGDVERVDLSLFENTADTNNSVLLEASVPLLSLVDHAVEFTYRVVYASDTRNIRWLGTKDTNGRFIFVARNGDRLCPPVWISKGNGIWTGIVREPVVVADLKSVKCFGWAFTKDSTAESFHISRFIDVASFKSVTGPIFALALLPKTNSDTHVVFSPVLYTAQNGTLSLDGGVLLHPGGGETTLTAYTSFSTWKDHIPPGTVAFETQTSDFIAVSIRRFNMGHLHLLPVTGARAIVTLRMSDIASLAPSSSKIVLFNSHLRVAKFLPALSQSECLRIAVGPVNDMITAVPAYSVSASVSVAFLLRHPGSTAEPLKAKLNVQSEHPPSSGQELTIESAVSTAPSQSDPATIAQTRDGLKGYSFAFPRILSLAAYLFQYVWNFLSAVWSRPSSITITHIEQSVQETTTSPGLIFNVSGNPPLLVMGEDASKLLIRVDGKPLQTTPKDISKGLWLMEFADELPADADARRRIEILLYK